MTNLGIIGGLRPVGEPLEKAIDATVASCHIRPTGNRADLKRAN